MCVCASIIPGMTVSRPRSITSAPAGGAFVPIDVIRSSVTTMTTLVTTLPAGSIILPARIARVAARAGEAATISSAIAAAPVPSILPLPFLFGLRSVLILCSRFFDLTGNLAGQPVRRDHPRERTEAEDPARKRAIEANIERHDHGPARSLSKPLRLVPLAAADVIGHRRLKLDFDPFRRSRMHAERMRKGFVRQLLDRREALLSKRQLLNPFDGEGPHLGIFRNVSEQVEPALRVGEPVRV